MASIPPPASFSSTGSGEPAWDLARMYPVQGTWTHAEYLTLTDGSNWLVEYTAGCIEVLPMPTIEHQLIVKFLFRALDTYVESNHLGTVLFAPTRVYLAPDRYREPDLVFNFTENHARSGKRFYHGADLVMEVVSDEPGCRQRDLQQKPRDYAQGGISEYWIVDPQERQITVFCLVGEQYQTAGVYRAGTQAVSKLLPDFAVEVSRVWAAATR